MVPLLLLFLVQLATTAGRRSRPRYASLKDASNQYAVEVKTLRDWVRRGLLPAVRVGPRLLRIDLNDLDDLCRPVPAAGRPKRAKSA